MSLVVNTNVSSLNAQRHLDFNNRSLNKSMEKLASGFRINRAGDDAAGLQLSENLRAEIRGSHKALQNVQDGINMLRYLDGQYQTITNNMQRMRELAVQASNDTYANEQRDAIYQEYSHLWNEINRINRSTNWNGVRLMGFYGIAPSEYLIQAGANDTANDILDISLAFGDSVGTTLNSGMQSPDGFALNSLAWTAVPGAIHNSNTWQHLIFTTSFGSAGGQEMGLDIGLRNVGRLRGNLGALINRLEGAAENLQISIENHSTSESRIRDVDVAAQTAESTRDQILQQSSAAMLAQANQAPSIALQLLQS